MNNTHAKRFNAQRAARRALKNPDAKEGTDFTTRKIGDGWVIEYPTPKGANVESLAEHRQKRNGAKAAKGKARKVKPLAADATPKPRGAWAKRALEAATHGRLPEPPDFSAETHRPHRKKLAEVVSMAERGDLDALMALRINPTSTSPKAIIRYQNFAIQALKVQRADGRPATQMSPEEWEAKLIREATSWVATKPLGHGNYDRREGFKNVEQAERAAVDMGNRAMVYAITPQGRQVLVGGVQGGEYSRTKSAADVLGAAA